MGFDTEYWRDFLSQVGDGVASWLPALGGALLLLATGWVAARFSRALIGSVSRRVGIDRLGEKAGVQAFLDSLPHKTTASALLSRLVYLVVLLVFVMAAVESLGLSGVTETLGRLVAYLPNMIAAVLVLLGGALLSQVIGDTVGAALATRYGAAAGHTVGSAAHYVLLVVVAILSLQQLGVDTALLVTLTMSLVTAVAFALALAFGLGNRELARNIMAGLHAKEEFEVDQRLRVQGHEGRLVRIGTVKSIFDTEDGRLSLPNLLLIEDEVLVLDPGSGHVADHSGQSDVETGSVD